MALNFLWKQSFRILLAFLVMTQVHAKSKIYTQFNNCQKKTAGIFALKIYKKFEEKKSLYDVKKWVEIEHQDQRHFIEKYVASYDPFSKKLILDLVCPKPLVKLYNAKNSRDDLGPEGIISDNGILYDPTLELTLTKSNGNERFIPSFTIFEELLKEEKMNDFINFAKKSQHGIGENISEYILQANNELLMVLSTDYGPVSVFLGNEQWQEKGDKLIKMYGYFSTKKSFPKVINLQNFKKVVVKY